MKELTRGSLLAIEAVGFLLLALAVCADEMLDIPSLLGYPASEMSWGDIIVECSAITVVAAIVIAITWKFYPAAKAAAAIPVIAVCAVCQKVCIDGKWVAMGSFIEEGSSASFTHGICPDCMDTYYKGVTDTTAINYRQFLRGRKTS